MINVMTGRTQDNPGRNHAQLGHDSFENCLRGNSVVPKVPRCYLLGLTRLLYIRILHYGLRT